MKYVISKEYNEGKEINRMDGIPYPNGPKYKKGVVEVMLSWDQCYPAVDLDLHVAWDAGEIDIHDDENASFEHFVIEKEKDIIPSNVPHVVTVTDKSDHSKIDKERIALYDPIDIWLLASTPDGKKLFRTQVNSIFQLNLGKVLEITAKKQFIGAPNNGMNGRDELNSDECKGDKSCACYPCEYIIKGFLSSVELGPIREAFVKIQSIKNNKVMYEGKTTSGEDVVSAGIIDIPKDVSDTFKDDEIYLIEIEGGEDIDSNDDFYVDAVPTKNNGKLHAIVTGKQLKYLSFKVNILAEIAYQVSKDVLNEEKNELLIHLDNIAKKIFRRKMVSIDGEYSLNYTDILTWIPAMDKKSLKKDYDIYVEPIVQKVYANQDITQESFKFVYEQTDKNTPELVPLSIKISKKLPFGALIGNFNILNSGDSKIIKIDLSGDGSENFTVNTNGEVRIAKDANLSKKSFYKIQAIATNENNHSSIPVEMYNAPFFQDQ